MSKKQRETSRAERAAAVRQQQASQERRRRVTITLVVLAVLAIIITGGVLLGGGKKAPSTASTNMQAQVDGQALAIGSDPKATKVVIYEDFLCPYCREFESASRSMLRDAAAKGDAYVEYRPFHLLQDPYSTLALTAWAAVLQKGTPEQALKFHDLLYDNQPYESDTSKPTIDDLVALAKKAGVTSKAVQSAMRESDQPFVDAADKSATDAGVEGTPTVIVDGKTLQGSPPDLTSQLKQLLAK
jgi:protein-disulfide isomerase